MHLCGMLKICIVDNSHRRKQSFDMVVEVGVIEVKVDGVIDVVDVSMIEEMMTLLNKLLYYIGWCCSTKGIIGSWLVA